MYIHTYVLGGCTVHARRNERAQAEKEKEKKERKKEREEREDGKKVNKGGV